MTYKTILAVLDTPDHAQQITDYALALASRFDAHVLGVHAETLAAVPLIAPMEIPDPAAIEALQEAARRETKEVEAIFRERVARDGRSADWRSFVSSSGYAAAAVMETVRAADLIVASQGDPNHENRSELENLLFDSGRPVLLVPYVMKAPRDIRRVMIAWNGSREAARAAFDALPFLKTAESVEIFCLDAPERPNQSKEFAGVELAAALARHGVNVTLTTQESGGISAAAAIENRLADKSVDLLVMGAYGTSRWWEMLFGGVTRSLLESMTALSLMSR
ncbi:MULTISPECIES: universal stress protein [Pseudorhizobium]|uniref:Nucleotide-binding universal stress UspA family protein n=2 Tax=Pseudorhizobium TaxID=1903858 RepID=A0A7W9YW09_9HYPH|nr:MULTISPECIES: universal stress protein [Pseudorhizobium]MBB6179317.1 nucleotide-binding universal stress UspA family protein [Pseudorhizobium flavum]CAD6604423.1 universal stress protein [Pseudorhizobium flavum]CAD7031392.1 universal stress protein [Pseudorhizobium halotolerans]